MATRQFTLILDDERSPREAELIKVLSALGRTERQTALRGLLTLSHQLKCDDPALYNLSLALMDVKAEGKDNFDKLADMVMNYRSSTPLEAKEAASTDTTETSVSEPETEPETEAEADEQAEEQLELDVDAEEDKEPKVSVKSYVQ
ncbi:hypothetical protein RBG11_004239 [Vibrio parahaemolyticus]|nr:hypothetical protein [Vibrio parahaemolyticus]